MTAAYLCAFSIATVYTATVKVYSWLKTLISLISLRLLEWLCSGTALRCRILSSRHFAPSSLIGRFMKTSGLNLSNKRSIVSVTSRIKHRFNHKHVLKHCMLMTTAVETLIGCLSHGISYKLTVRIGWNSDKMNIKWSLEWKNVDASRHSHPVCDEDLLLCSFKRIRNTCHVRGTVDEPFNRCVLASRCKRLEGVDACDVSSVLLHRYFDFFRPTRSFLRAATLQRQFSERTFVADVTTSISKLKSWVVFSKCRRLNLFRFEMTSPVE